MIRRAWRAVRRALTLRNVRKARDQVVKYRQKLDRAAEKLRELERRYLNGGGQ